MEVHCSATYQDRAHSYTTTPNVSDDTPAFCKLKRCWYRKPNFSVKTQLFRISATSIPSCNPRRLAHSHLERAGAPLPHRAFCDDFGVSLCVPHRSAGVRQRTGGLTQRRVLFRSIRQHLEGSSSILNQDESEDGEKGTLLPTPLSPSSFSPSADTLSEISDESFNETRRLVETAMLAAAAGLAYFLSNTFRIENYFGCFFPLPLVISSLRWGVSAGRKTMVATGMLLFVLSGPLKAATYLLMHGFLGLTMGALWRSKISWGTSLFICTLVRSIGAMGFVFLTSWLIRENLLVLITINAHASISLLLATMGINFVPSMGSIYFIFGTLVLLNCGTFVLILHLLYAIFLKRLELNSSLIFPAWLKAL